MANLDDGDLSDLDTSGSAQHTLDLAEDSDYGEMDIRMTFRALTDSR